ncbi:GDP-mannose transporter [Angomonas deanei]|uniref:Triose-phosphate Transporter family/EamA-like transporter family, putative n=1 Tax=Angomonas deanei TaxID=59799 RepID=A0A7G2CK29_9TRYP|nr:GDP-mannose transporter [Angomonas deanei]CAD2219244.1 Triose-phosphate Transporter family/EamA-like transporter family, putative [Angomonas deanei]|eukprot:EPY38305.1 GDP-mannose transporter [Angomonas deanei]
MGAADELIYAVWLFTVSSVGMMLGNKLAVTALPLSSTLVCLQSVGTLVLLGCFCRKEIKGVNMRVIKSWVPIAAIFTFMLYTSLKSFSYVNVSTVIILRNVGSIVTSVVEYFVLGERVNLEIILSEFVILFGAFLYGYKNANFNLIGGLWVFLNLVGQVAYGITLKHYMTRTVEFSAMSKYTMSLLNNALAIPFLTVLILANEISQVGTAISKVTFSGWFWIAFTCFLGFLISTSGFGLQKLVSATTFIVVNNLVKFFNIILGVIFLKDKMAYVDGAGCVIALAGGAWYSFALYNFKKKNEERDKDKDKQVDEHSEIIKIEEEQEGKV